MKDKNIVVTVKRLGGALAKASYQVKRMVGAASVEAYNESTRESRKVLVGDLIDQDEAEALALSPAITLNVEAAR